MHNALKTLGLHLVVTSVDWGPVMNLKELFAAMKKQAPASIAEEVQRQVTVVDGSGGKRVHCIQKLRRSQRSW